MDADQVAGELGAMSARIGAGVERALQKTGAQHVRTATKELFTGPPDSLQSRSGGLRRSLGWATRGAGLASELTVFAGPPARTHEYGAVIHAKRARYLTIPLRAALTPSGVPRKPNARAWDDAFILKARSGKLFLARKRGKRGLDLLYKLQESVRIPARFGFRKHFQTITVPFLKAELAKVV